MLNKFMEDKLMKCVICKVGETKNIKITKKLILDSGFSVLSKYKGATGKRCMECGEIYVSGATVRKVLTQDAPPPVQQTVSLSTSSAKELLQLYTDLVIALNKRKKKCGICQNRDKTVRFRPEEYDWMCWECYNK